ncbi:hypothetical protein [Chitinimonas sp. JJ19]|uniref:hypothetical protein n=1 Tax=Chitinimonas sp. JJ19 TaxID=3109352 RepID=UPI0030015A84
MHQQHIQLLDLGDATWRVDWFGELGYPDLSRRQSQPSVQVMLSPVPDGPFGALRAQQQAASANQRKVHLPVGFLPAVHVGSTWRKGILIGEDASSAEVEVFDDLDVSRDNVQTIKAGTPSERGHYLPLQQHAAHRMHTGSYCVLIRLADDRQLIVPCWELIRFYFGSSSNLLACVVQPGVTKQMLFADSVYHPRSGYLHLDLAEGISGWSASDVGRLALSSEAWAAAKLIGASCARASGQRAPIYPITRFPFEGTTDLHAEGKWLSHGPDAQRTFIVSRLLSCSHAFPFQSLRFSTARQRAASTNGTHSQAPQHRHARKGSSATQVNEDPGRVLTPGRRPIATQQRFPDLADKWIWRCDEAKAAPTEGQQRLAAGGHAESVGTPSGSNRVRSVDLGLVDVAETGDGGEKLPVFVRKGLWRLWSIDDDLAIDLVRWGAEKKPVVTMPVRRDERGRLLVSCWLGCNVAKQEHRSLALCRISSHGAYGEAVAIVGAANGDVALFTLLESSAQDQHLLLEAVACLS